MRPRRSASNSAKARARQNRPSRRRERVDAWGRTEVAEARRLVDLCLEAGSSRRRLDAERLYSVVDALASIAAATGKTIPQIAINWLLRRPTVATVLIGARNEQQLRENLGAVGWSLSPEHSAQLDAASRATPPYPYYPYWNGQFAERAPAPV